jgi:hypothetical protein
MKAAGMSGDIASKELSPEYKTELRKLLSIAPLAVVAFGPGIHRALWQAALCERSSVAEPTRRKGDRQDSYLAGKICGGRTAPSRAEGSMWQVFTRNVSRDHIPDYRFRNLILISTVQAIMRTRP